VPTWVLIGGSSPLFPYSLVALGFWVGIPLWQAIEQPGPFRVQAAVKRAIFGLVLLDATLATALAGSWGKQFRLVVCDPRHGEDADHQPDAKAPLPACRFSRISCNERRADN
jgi:hypothetical protein